MCPFCRKNKGAVVKRGCFSRARVPSLQVQRYYCKACRRWFSTRTGTMTFREQKSHVNQALYKLLCSGVSQRRCAEILKVHRTTVARKLCKMGKQAALENDVWRATSPIDNVIVFDEMETFEHTKCKPLSIAVAVEEGSRKIISMEVASMPAKGTLAVLSRQKYGPRVDGRPAALGQMMQRIKQASQTVRHLKSDQSPRYPKVVKAAFPEALHERFKGRRGCVVGQGELKRGGHDPLFSLNHSCAMVRDNIKRLSRRTWCTTKRPDRLGYLLELYMSFHNSRLLKIEPCLG